MTVDCLRVRTSCEFDTHQFMHVDDAAQHQFRPPTRAFLRGGESTKGWINPTICSKAFHEALALSVHAIEHG